MSGQVPARLNIVTLGVSDFSRMRKFYESLGWPSDPVGESFVSFDLGGALLALYPLEDLAREAGMSPRPDTEDFSGFTCAVNVESEELVDISVESVREAGGRILSEPVNREWGGRSAYFADPEGNVWEIGYAPGTAFDEKGNMIDFG